jgi:hypothetical protein
MNLTYLIISLVIIVSIIAILYLSTPAENRTDYPDWNESTKSAQVGTGALWQSDSKGSDKKPEYLKFIDSEFFDSDRTQRELTVAWIENKVNAGGPDSQTSQGTSGISSILVKDINGNEKELPIMDFFEKIHGDIYTGWLRAKDYINYELNQLHINLDDKIDDNARQLVTWTMEETGRLDREKLTAGREHYLKFPVAGGDGIQVDPSRWLKATAGGFGDTVIISPA